MVCKRGAGRVEDRMASTVADLLSRVRTIRIPRPGMPVERTVARELAAGRARTASVREVPLHALRSEPSALNAAVFRPGLGGVARRLGVESRGGGEWVYFGLDGRGCFWLLASRPAFLFAGLTRALESLAGGPGRPFRWFRPLSFSVERSAFDLFLTQYARLIRGFDREAYIREHARLGFSHLEVNALAGPHPFEKRSTVPGEFYPDFYTYCPALDQFVSSRLTAGLYPEAYLRANLCRLKDNARLAAKYGLAPGLLCFEPRSLPESFFRKYPTLRGPRVDHPFRSYRPRYSLTLVHPAAREHYAELLSRLMAEVPELEFLTIWSNDSGSGFEHTRSLYVGRNGGPYLIREWKDDEEIARAAAGNIGRFLRLLQVTGARVNPLFRVVTRLESFYGERRYLWPLLGQGVDVEVNSLLASGWETNYPHPRYPDIRVLGSALHNSLKPGEAGPRRDLEARGGRAGFYHYLGSFANHEPLLGVPFPWLVWEKLRACRRAGVSTLVHHGGIQPPGKVPYPVNQEVFRAFQFKPGQGVERAVRDVAERWVGPRRASDLVRAWRHIDRSVRAFPPLSIYSGYGVVWQRLFVRPLVPNIDRIPEEERAYYERQMCTSVHNPNRVDLARDVLFQLLTPESAARAAARIDREAGPPLETARRLLDAAREDCRRTAEAEAGRVFEDLFWRVLALRCLQTSLRNLASWVSSVHGWLGARTAARKREARARLRALNRSEVANSLELRRLWEESPVEWMIISGAGETPFLYGPNFPELLDRKIRLIKKFGRARPHLDPDFMFRLAPVPGRRGPAQRT
jgi:hypothetical protein